MLRFDEYYDAYSKELFQFIYFLVGHKETAEDLTQDTFIKALKNSTTFRGDAQMKTWLVTIARNTVYDYYRRKRLIKFIPFIARYDGIEETYIPEQWLLKQAADAELYTALGQLKLAYRECIVLRKIEGYSIKETADILNCTEAQVRNHRERGMRALQKLLGGEANETR
ncbi:RNA polymerase sigma factor [Metasolibacillus sp.]|uniref:RNA polymerase sigma factor n=1 Tax=Metasolibacillus sp. TaxID=2703680 RepID=UPI0025F16C99|nr:RNA polymerase sigma factor [Metasolibacillus sp.]MCT6922676.1 RNA polymerase sigma factor [Metasolibacillus sp.]MCT6938985.1 RNA polymerase sigma factor [Metasolibacillus sp.]